MSGRNETSRLINFSLINLLGKGKKHFSGFDVLDKRISVKQIIAELKVKVKTR